MTTLARPLPVTVEALELIAAAQSPRTLAAYRSDWRDWSDWCAVQDPPVPPVPAMPETIARYIRDLADRGRKAATIQRRVASIATFHRWAGFADPPTRQSVVTLTLRRIYREIGTAPDKARPLLLPELAAIAAALDTDAPQDVRDRALILVGWAGALRRSELAAMRVEHLTRETGGIALLIPMSKTDKMGAGQTIALPYATRRPDLCPVAALDKWLGVLGNPTAGPIWRSARRPECSIEPQRVDFVLKAAARRAGLSHAYSAHSLRAGHATSAAEHGVEERIIQAQTRHRSERVLRGYIRSGQLFAQNSAAAML